MRISAVGPGSAQISLPTVSGADRARVLRDGRLLDVIDLDVSSTYTDRLLWEGSSYRYTVELLSRSGTPLGSYGGAVTTPRRSGPFERLFSPSSFVNAPVGSAPELEQGSRRIVDAALEPYVDNANLSNSDSWGVPIAYSNPGGSRYSVGCERYWCDVPFPAVSIPAYAEASQASDGHLAVIDPETGSEMDMWQGERRNGRWVASTRWLTTATGSGVNCSPGEHCGGANVAAFALTAGIVRPEEIAQGHIDHALMITTPYTHEERVACPARHTDGNHADPAAMPIGARVQLDPSIDLSELDLARWQRVIAAALQKYGAYVVDTGGSLSIRAESSLLRGYDAWAKAGVTGDSPSLRELPWSKMRVLSSERC